MRKILFVGNANSFLIFQLARHIKMVHPSWRIDILSEHLFELENAPYDNIFAVDNNHPYAKKKYIKAWYLASQLKKLIKQLDNDYDCIQILYLSSAYRFIWSKMKRLASKKVVTVFGGDFYKANFFMKSLMSKIVSDSDVISATNPDTLVEFSNYFNVPETKKQLVRFGLSILDEIDSLSQREISEWKVKNTIPEGKITIACGYNKSPNQNLQELIQVIILESELLSRCVFCFQFAGEETSYTRRVINLLNENHVDFRIFSERFSDRELAIYRRAMNLMIQVQATDSFSGAMQEHLYAGSFVITGKWLPYAVLDDEGVDYLRVNSIDEVGKAISENLERIPNKDKNKSVIAGFSKWSTTINSWINLLS